MIAEGTEYSYAEIKKLIDKTSAYLYKRGIRAGDRAALTGSRNVYTVVAIYALLKLGAAYVPLEDNYPKKRVEYILCNCGANRLIVTDPDIELAYDDIETIDLSKGIPDGCPDAELSADKTVDPCCYIIYTSGTTGQPKGTAIRSDDLLDLVYWYIDELSLDSQCRVLLLNAFGFDASVKNIFAPLLIGGTLILGSRDLYNIDSSDTLCCGGKCVCLFIYVQGFRQRTGGTVFKGARENICPVPLSFLLHCPYCHDRSDISDR